MKRLIVMTAALALAAGSNGRADELPTLFHTGFETGGLEAWTVADPAAWKLAQGDGGKVLALVKRHSAYQPKVRSPHNIALLDGVVVSDFVLDVKVRSTEDTGNHRDLCLFFGHQDPEHFYYVHLGKKADPHAHSIFAVDGSPRVSIAKERTEGTPWTDGWHRIRLTRNAGTGDIRVYFDDMDRPVMQATDKRFEWGKVGIGSFDDVGEFDDFLLKGRMKDPR